MRDTPARDRVFIGIARTRNPMRQRSTLAHEHGHATFKDWNVHRLVSTVTVLYKAAGSGSLPLAVA